MREWADNIRGWHSGERNGRFRIAHAILQDIRLFSRPDDVSSTNDGAAAGDCGFRLKMKEGNFAEQIHPIEYYSVHGEYGEPPSPTHFRHDPHPGRPKLPDLSKLEKIERQTIENWLEHYDVGSMDVIPIDSHKPKQRIDGESELSKDAKDIVDKIAKIIGTSAYREWKIGNILKRKADWRWNSATAHHEAGAKMMRKFRE